MKKPAEKQGGEYWDGYRDGLAHGRRNGWREGVKAVSGALHHVELGDHAVGARIFAVIRRLLEEGPKDES